MRLMLAHRMLGMIIFVLLLLGALWMDVPDWRRKTQQHGAEQLYWHTYPARKIFSRYVQPYLDEKGHASLNQLWLLHTQTGMLKEALAARYAVAILDGRDGVSRIAFPDHPALVGASFTVLGWDGLALAGGEAKGSHEFQLNGFGSALLFLRLPDLDNVSQHTLDSIGPRMPSASSMDFSSVRCPVPQGPESWLGCAESLLPIIGASPAYLAELAQYQHRMGSASSLDLGFVFQEAEKSMDMALQHSAGYMIASRWVVYRDFYRLNPSMVDPLLIRAAFFAAPFMPVPDSKTRAAVLRFDDQGRLFRGDEGDFRLRFNVAQLSPETLDWSFSIYGEGMAQLFVGDKESLVRRDQVQPDHDGIVELYLSVSRPDDVPEVNWLPVPAGAFTVIYRAQTRIPLDPHDDFGALGALERVGALSAQ
ncbi:MAG: DUF1214 domain-containing protein [Gammaproteobacteria bacterium]|nr:MAG: DUF1214 domain-containing protein [Gammaproteobacteria bacterium]